MVEIDKKILEDAIAKINENLDKLVEKYKEKSKEKINLYEFKVGGKNIIEKLDIKEKQLLKFAYFKSNFLNIATFPCKQKGRNVSLFKVFPDEILTIHHNIDKIIEYIKSVKQGNIKKLAKENKIEISNLKRELENFNDFNQKVEKKFGSYETEMKNLRDAIKGVDNRLSNIETYLAKNKIWQKVLFGVLLTTSVLGVSLGVKSCVKDTEQDTKIENMQTKDAEQDARLDNIEAKDTKQDERLDNIEAKDTKQNERPDELEKNQTQSASQQETKTPVKDDFEIGTEKIKQKQETEQKKPTIKIGDGNYDNQEVINNALKNFTSNKKYFK